MPRSCSRSSARRWCRRRCSAPRSPNSPCSPLGRAPDAEAIERLAEGTSIGTVVFDPGYVVNGDVADVVVAADGTRLTRWTTFTAHRVDTMDLTRRLARVEAKGLRRHRRRPRPRRHGGDPASRRADRRGDEVSGSDRRLHQGPRAVRPPDRQLPGAQAPDGRPVRRGAIRAGGRQRRDRRAIARRPRRWRGWRPARRSRRWRPKPSRCTAGSRSPGSTISSCTSSVHTAALNYWARRGSTCAASNPRCSNPGISA